MEKHRTRFYYFECVYFWHKSLCCLSLTEIVVVVVVGKQQLLPTVSQCAEGRAGGKVGKYQTKSDANWALRCWKFSIFLPLSARAFLLSNQASSSVSVIVSIRIPEKQTWNWFSVAAFRFDSIRSVRCSGKSGWLLPVFLLFFCMILLFLGSGIHTFVCSFVRVDGLLIIFCSDTRCVDNYAIVATFTDTFPNSDHTNFLLF